MKQNLLALFILVIAALLFGDVADKVTKLSADNERLRVFNARRDRRLHRPPASPREASISQASHILGTPIEVIRAVWIQENGPVDIETGSIGKTDHFAKHFPIEDWAALEAARTMNRLAFNWFLQTPEGRIAYEKMLGYSAQTYAAVGHEGNERWAKNIYQFSLTKSAK